MTDMEFSRIAERRAEMARAARDLGLLGRAQIVWLAISHGALLALCFGGLWLDSLALAVAAWLTLPAWLAGDMAIEADMARCRSVWHRNWLDVGRAARRLA